MLSGRLNWPSHLRNAHLTRNKFTNLKKYKFGPKKKEFVPFSRKNVQSHQKRKLKNTKKKKKFTGLSWVFFGQSKTYFQASTKSQILGGFMDEDKYAVASTFSVYILFSTLLSVAYLFSGIHVSENVFSLLLFMKPL